VIVPDAPVVSVDTVSKWYGSVVAVSEVSFDVRPGITGLLGPNGAGKTTLLRMMCGLAGVSQGRVSVFGSDPRETIDLYRRIGVMTEHESTYDLLTGRALVEWFARLRNVPDPGAAAGRAIGEVGLAEAADRRVRTYSRGMRQRIKLATTIVHDPELLILDEPLNGADPRQRVDFQELLCRLAREGRTIVISSHILEEVELLADRVLLMVNGKLAAEGDHHAIRAALDKRPYHLRVACDQPRRLAAALVALDAVDSVELDPDGFVVLSRDVGVVQLALPRVAAELSVRLTRVEPLDDSLESVFEYLVEQ
jgi:ABC-2 type transport system ATP-binding protein